MGSGGGGWEIARGRAGGVIRGLPGGDIACRDAPRRLAGSQEACGIAALAPRRGRWRAGARRGGRQETGRRRGSAGSGRQRFPACAGSWRRRLMARPRTSRRAAGRLRHDLARADLRRRALAAASCMPGAPRSGAARSQSPPVERRGPDTGGAQTWDGSVGDRVARVHARVALVGVRARCCRANRVPLGVAAAISPG